MLTYREAAAAVQAELDQAETASHLAEESRCAMILGALQIAVHCVICNHVMCRNKWLSSYMITDDTVDS